MSVSLKVGKKDLPRLIIALLFCAAGIILSVLQGFYDSIFWYAGLFLLTVPTVTYDILHADDQSCKPQEYRR